MLFKLIRKTFALLFILFFTSCLNLTVENLESPDLERVLSGPEQIIDYSGNAFRILFNTLQEYDSPALAMSAMADQNTCS